MQRGLWLYPPSGAAAPPGGYNGTEGMKLLAGLAVLALLILWGLILRRSR